MTAYSPPRRLPTAAELPHSDETPVDNQLQDDIPQLLKSVLQTIWDDRQDWFFAVDMAFYYNPDEPAIVPDAFLALGVERLKDINGRLSYVLWEENNVLPLLTLEVVSQKYNGEYEEKLVDYQNIGILYYVIYNPRAGKGRKFFKRSPLEVYKRVNGVYQLQSGNPVWMPEIGLGIGCETTEQGGWNREWVYWYNEQGDRYLTNRELRWKEYQKRLEEQEKRIQAEWIASQEREQRRQAEKAVLQEQQQRRQAEKAVLQEQQQRLAAEQEEREAKKRLAELEARIKKLGLDL